MPVPSRVPSRPLAPIAVALVVGAVGLAACPPADTGDDDGDVDTSALEYADAGIPDRPPPPEPEEIEVCIPIAPLPDTALPRCTAETRACVGACPQEGGEACRDACFAADTTPPLGDTGCNDCVFIQLLSCLQAAGCDAEVAEFMCCLADTQFAGPCDAQTQLMFGCGIGRAPSCFDLTSGDVGRCYAAE